MLLQVRDQTDRAELLRRATLAARRITAPQAAVILLTIALIATIAHEVGVLWQLMRLTVPSGGLTPPRHESQEATAGAIAAAHLFGSPAAPPPGDSGSPPPENTTLVLTGTIATPDPGKGFALVGTAAASTHVYAAGDTMSEGALLREVYSDRVIFELDGRLQTLTLPHRMDFQSLQTAAVPRGDSAETAAATPEARSDDVVARLDAETKQMAALLKEKPVFSGPQFRGVLLEAGSSPGMLERLGLKPGDMLHHVNGVMIADPDRVQLLRQALASGKPVQVGITRLGEGALDLTLDSSLVAGLVQQ